MKTLTTTLLISLALVGAGAQAAGVEQAKSSAQVATELQQAKVCLLYTSPSPRDRQKSRMPSSA